MNDPHAPNNLIGQLCDEIFLADGGVDDFEELSPEELLVIIRRELPNALAGLVLSHATEMQVRPYA